ncbi:MAG TPA: tail fiber protein [Alphaproteobacteria bacterium]|nr:tail fiber protein [Alphaproteobacteria bacterium]
MSNAYIGEIRCFGFNFPPADWALCLGQLMPISQYEALYTIIGTTYGGNGTSNFALPNLAGSALMGQGQGPGLTNRLLGQAVGTAAVTLTNNQLPSHLHTLNASVSNTKSQEKGTPSNQAYLGLSTPGKAWSTTAPNQGLAPQGIGSTGGSQPHNNMQPVLTMNFCICLLGIYPVRN